MNLEYIFDTYYDRLYKFTLFRVQNLHDAEDITSDVFLKAARNLHRYNEEKASLSTWLHSIALNTIRDYYRTRRDVLPLEDTEYLPMQDNPEESVLRNEQARMLYDAIGKLNERQRSIVLLRYIGGMSGEETARLLKISVSNAETILSRAKKTLKNLLEKCEVSGADSYNLSRDHKKEIDKYVR